ncbi:hypothetical protein [Paenibacillus roseipurpureus]|uniref:Flagellar protein FliT n=1 Tax=Paenibacillus roseopurpureus TaxID=2918901 RepID=A0AA96LMX6_9BACL|nr:hypothetical protein [Paenibacillus sp. MBLB1832]WNR44700.1 hypothetical protein MJB10_00595 [Paenibacillus sp. MBLB1832]
MDDLLVQLEIHTQQGLSALSNMDTEQISEYMERRSQIMKLLLHASPTLQQKREYKNRVKMVLSHDTIFIRKLEQLRDEASLQISKIETGKTQRMSYDKAYTGESYFFDLKK